MILIIALAFLLLASNAEAGAVWGCFGQTCQHLTARSGDTFSAQDSDSSIPWQVAGSAPSCSSEGQAYWHSSNDRINVCDDSSWVTFYSGAHTTDTGPSPDCSGTLTYQDGEGACDTYTLAGNTTELATVASKTSGRCAQFDANGNIGAAGAACSSGGGGSVAGSDTEVQFNDGGSAFGADDRFRWVKSNHRLVIGDADYGWGAISAYGSGSTEVGIVSAYVGSGATTSGFNVLGKASGSVGSPGAVPDDDLIARWWALGHNGSSFVNSCQMNVYADGAFSGSNQGSDWELTCPLNDNTGLTARIQALGSGEIHIRDKTIFGQNLDNTTLTTAGDESYFLFLDDLDIDVSPSSGASNLKIIDINSTLHYGQSAVSLSTFTSFANETVFNYDDASNSVIFVPWTFNNGSTAKRTANGTFLTLAQSYRDTPSYENGDASAWTVNSHTTLVSSPIIKNTGSMGDITLLAGKGVSSQPQFSCGNGNCTITSWVDFYAPSAAYGSGAGTEDITTRYGLQILADTRADKHYGIYNEALTQFPSVTTAISATFTLTPTSTFMVLNPDASITSSASTAINDGVDGQTVVLINGDTGSDTITLKDSANTELAGDFTMKPGDTITLVYSTNRADWQEVTRSANDAPAGGGGSDSILQIGGTKDSDATNNFVGPWGTGNYSTTAANAEWDVDADLTITAMECKQTGDSSCTLGITLQDTGSTATDAVGNLDTECSSVNQAQCDVAGSSSYSAGDGLSVKITTNSGCGGSGMKGWGCVIRYSYD